MDDKEQTNYNSMVNMATITNNHDLKLSTVTMICSIDKPSLIDLSVIAEYCKNASYDQYQLQIKYSNSRSDFEVTKRGKVKKSFFNQLTMNLRKNQGTNKSVKVFTNGRIHMTGLHTFDDIRDVPIYVENILTKSLESSVKIIHNQICMMNFVVNTKMNLDLYYFCTMLCKNQITTFSYEPQTYAALNLKYNINDSDKTLLIFKSGKVIISGCKNVQKDLHSTYEHLCRLLHIYSN